MPARTDDAVLDDLAETARAVQVSSRTERAGWLRGIADRLEAERDGLVAIADRETRPGEARLGGEVLRTTGQLRMFAEVVEEGSYLEAVVDTADPAAAPPRPEIRRLLRPIGPVAVFAASNFPFAFSVAGGDTASALAAGCPVVVKAHSGHPELSRETARLVREALAAAGAPAGTFALVEGRETGLRLARAAAIRAVAFTGSLAGGRGLLAAIAERPDPIPFFGELGSVNPVVVTPGAVEARGDAIADGLVDSFTLGAGQFCTKPGIVFVPAGFASRDALRRAVERRPAFALLTERITDAFLPGTDRLRAAGDVQVVAGSVSRGVDGVTAAVLHTTVANVIRNSDALLEECFGPLTLLVEYRSLDEVHAALALIDGSLTATVHAEEHERDEVEGLVDILAERAGRVLFDGWPTGVAVTWGQHHGGPWPATTSQHTSVGASAIRRFLRPVAFQNAPEYALPADLRDDALTRIPHRVDGRLIVP
ncbi:aldehyde dehydrogenase (NADP(+)) [Herbiconiux sp. CPCC 205763]|uniref:Aldehyde dehydrogenase (NADP(+)) n=1 Tax=Herbiconiux aconitum TaxID=2970913 RepID=A0ABT2GPI7_9MICO|nr:aldehyde dehydrogenase (NADP(+)) [Herbiconiux aconitum]MCS5717512.1 aldehyde dehydrogenase (NADP(+)) [Herbiconiux aconitum]